MSKKDSKAVAKILENAEKLGNLKAVLKALKKER